MNQFCVSISEWRSNFHLLSKRWLAFNLSWLRFKGDLHILRYEKLKSNLEDELQGVCHFMGIDVSKRRMNCVIVNQEGNYHRPGSNKTETAFTKQMKDVITSFTQKVEHAISERRYLRST